jgi:hypothetical protein
VHELQCSESFGCYYLQEVREALQDQAEEQEEDCEGIVLGFFFCSGFL